MTKPETKQHILKTGEQLILQKGYGSTGLNEVLERSGVPKGSFYYYFSSKEDFGLQVLDYYYHNNRAALYGLLHDTAYTPIRRLKNYFQRSIDFLASVNYNCGCLIGTVGQEMSSQNEQFRVKIDELLVSWAADVAQCLREAQAVGELPPDADVEALAQFCLNSWQGATLRMKVLKNSEPLDNFMQVIFNTLLRG